MRHEFTVRFDRDLEANRSDALQALRHILQRTYDEYGMEGDFLILDTTDADALHQALIDLPADAAGKMQRAWRNRSNCTCWAWERCAATLGNRHLAGVIYAACGILAGEQFDPAGWPAEQWEALAALVAHYRKHKPDKALERGEYEQRRAGA